MHAFLSAVILLFSFWWIEASRWIIIVSAAIIFVWEIILLSSEGCSGYGSNGLFRERTGAELFMEKSDDELHEGPSRKEVRETLNKKKK